jgi:uncharacterized protein YjbI with pentapeptide repeats
MQQDVTRNAPEGETQVNPYSLLEAVNHSSDTAHTAWLIFLAVMAYLLIATAGVTHKDLLLETPVSLPILQVDIQLAQFFQFAPVLLVLMHLGVVSQLTLLARETLEFDHSVRLLEATDKRTHPLRLELNNFFFVQAIAGPYRSRVMSAFLHGMSWLTLVVLPVVLMLYIQVVFLPYHDVLITWTHRIALMADIAMLIAIGVFLMRAETSFVHAFMRTTSAHPASFVSTIFVLLFVSVFSFFFATIPGEQLDRWTQRILGFNNEDETGQTPRFVAGYAVPWLTFGSDGSLLGVFQRNLVVTDTDLVSDKEQTPGEPSLSLRNRDLRWAKLDRSDLHQADLTGSDLRGASLTGVDLRGAWLHCADVTQLILTEDRVAANCTTARRANLSRAKLDQAHMTGIDLRNAKLEEAKLEGAELAYSLMPGANFTSARLDKADLTGGVQAQGASFLLATLQGADMTGAQLQDADLSSANMQGAILNFAQLQAANLRDADLEGASLLQAWLHGADMTDAKITGADLRGARIWLTKPPQPDQEGMADAGEMLLSPIGEAEVASMKQMLERILSRRVRARVSESLAPLLDAATVAAWAQSPELGVWQNIAAASTQPSTEFYSPRLTDYLVRLQCKPRWSNGSVATGIARRAQAQQFRGDLIAIYDRLKADDCPASKTVLPKTLRDLSAAADLARGN